MGRFYILVIFGVSPILKILNELFSMYYFRASLLAGVAFWALSFSVAQAEPLEAAIGDALNNHPRVEAALAARDAAQQGYVESRAGYFPSLDVQSVMGRIYGNNSTSRGLDVERGAGYSGLWEGSATLKQLLFDGWETKRRVQAAQAREESALFDVVDVREQLAMQAIMSYLDVLRGREALVKIADHRRKLGDYIKRIENMVEEGAADESLLMKARDIQTQLLDMQARMAGQWRNSEAGYKEIIGHSADPDMTLPVLAAGVLPENPAEALALAQAHHPMLRAAYSSEEALGYEIDAERAKYTPTFDGELSYLERDQRDIIGGELVDARAVVRMNWNFSFGRAQRARLRQAEYRQAEGRAEREGTLRAIEKMIDVAYSDRNTAADQLSVLDDRVDLNRHLLETYQAQFEAARVDVLQLMQAENALFNAEIARLNGSYKLLASGYAVLASMGCLQQSLGVAAPDPGTTPEAPEVYITNDEKYLQGEEYILNEILPAAGDDGAEEDES